MVRAFNQNLPYDQFITWQLAGDLVENPTRESRLATAFNRLHRQTNEGGSVQLEWQTEYCADRVNTFGTAMLGLTLECARCHDHKYDPVSQQDYYNLFAFFNSIDEWGTYLNSSHVPTPSLLLPTEQQQAQVDQLQQQLDQVMESLEKRTRHLADEPLPTDTIDAPEQTSFWPIEALNAGNKLDNTIDDQSPATTSAANAIIERAGRTGLNMSGDDGVNFPGKTQLAPWQRYTIGLWLYLPESLDDAVILHRQQGTDVGMYGTELTLVNGKLRFAKNRFWPGNALAIETLETIPDQKWVQITITNDGSATAAGMQIYVDGQAATKIVRDDLTKNPGVGGSGFTVGERFRSPGLKDAIIDDVSFFDRNLSSLEILTLLGAQDSASDDDRRQHQRLHDQPWQQLANRRSELSAEILKTRAGFNETMVMEELPQPRPAYVLHRGEYDAPRTEENLATRAVPEFLHPLAPELPRNRLGLARWATSGQHPLTARVAVNQAWQILFGNGLVGTPEDFGLQGALPSHPQLLDWLARDFVDSGWDYKRLCKQIVLSRTYRQSSRATLEDRNRDSENRWLARGPAHRLSAEMIRDLALSASGLLNDQRGGPPVSPYQPEKLWRENNTMTPAYRQSVGKSLYRRSLYSVWKRTTPLPNMISFDATTREVCTVARAETNTPTQSLVLLNDVQFVEASRALAEAALKHADDLPDQIQWMFLQLAGRQAEAAELQVLTQLFDQQKTMFSDGLQDAAKLLEVGEAAADSTLPNNDLAAMTIVAQAIFNCDATVWKR